jgi:hypothetical protein
LYSDSKTLEELLMSKPFEKNDPRINRKGRPKKGECMTDILNWALDQKRIIKDGETGKEKSLLVRHILAERLISKAVDDGDVVAIKYIYDRLDGRPKETVEMSTNRNDIPDAPEERRALMEQLKREIDLTITKSEAAINQELCMTQDKKNPCLTAGQLPRT